MERRTAIRKLLMAGAVSIVPRLWGTRRQDEQQAFTIRSEVRLVLLDVSVKDRAGAFVPGLSKDSFKVFENGVGQPITVFAREDLPVTVGILVDESESMGHKRGDVLAAAGTLIAEGNPRDETFVLNFNDTVRRGLPEGQLFERYPTTEHRPVSRTARRQDGALRCGLRWLESTGTRGTRQESSSADQRWRRQC